MMVLALGAAFRHIAIALILLPVTALNAANPEYLAGVATVDITPREPIRLSGYASRTKPSGGVLLPIHAKAIVVARGRQQRIVIVTADLIGLPRTITDTAAARLQQKFGLMRAELLFNASHTHTGPFIRDNIPLLFELSPAEKVVVDKYAEFITDGLVEVTARALLNLAPATLAASHGEARFGINRRPLPGPVEPDVPVIRVTGANGKVMAILFGYACHNTTLTGENNDISGDYAGFAQQAIERTYAGATALFLMLCGADQNPSPRGTPALARQHGEVLAAEVSRVLVSPMTTVHGSIKSAFRVVDLEFESTDRATFEARVNHDNAAVARHAKAMLAKIDSGQQLRRYPYPVQAISMGSKLTLIALGGEVVADYALALKHAYPGVIVAGYSNDVMAYIPSLRVLREGGYEAIDSMYYYGLPAPWAENTEERIMTTVATVVKAVR